MFYRLEIKSVNSVRMSVVTEYGYEVTNRTAEPHPWPVAYTFKYGPGKVHDLRFNDEPVAYYTITDNKLSANRILGSATKARVYMKISENYKKADYELYTNSCPTSDLRVVVLDPTRSLEFSCENFSSGGQAPVQKKTAFGQEEVHLDDGLLPFQGIKLSWRARNGKKPAQRRPSRAR